MFPDNTFSLSFICLIIRSFDMTYGLIFLQVTPSCGHMILFYQQHSFCFIKSRCYETVEIYSCGES